MIQSLIYGLLVLWREFRTVSHQRWNLITPLPSIFIYLTLSEGFSTCAIWLPWEQQITLGGDRIFFLNREPLRVFYKMSPSLVYTCKFSECQQVYFAPVRPALRRSNLIVTEFLEFRPRFESKLQFIMRLNKASCCSNAINLN